MRIDDIGATRDRDAAFRRTLRVIIVTFTLMGVTFLGGLYLLVRFVKWAWQ
jgi:hypothetical protein